MYKSRFKKWTLMTGFVVQGHICKRINTSELNKTTFTFSTFQSEAISSALISYIITVWVSESNKTSISWTTKNMFHILSVKSLGTTTHSSCCPPVRLTVKWWETQIWCSAAVVKALELLCQSVHASTNFKRWFQSWRRNLRDYHCILWSNLHASSLQITGF